jgi:polysaccharide pyruvyl transferase WcaK-like protein/glycosyltransferase involved in cell wall biosynthesis
MTDTGHRPALTLGLPVRNGERFLEAALDALLAQTFTDFELIISDNASTDRTPTIARAYAAVDPRVRYTRHPRNVGSALNHALLVHQARGKYFKWVSDDDLYAPDLLERCMEAFDRQPGIVSSHAWTAYLDESGNIIRKPEYPLKTDSPRVPERFRSLLHTYGGDDMYGIFPVAVLRRIAPVRSHHLADRTFVSELALYGPFYNVPDFLYFRREHARRVSRSPSVRDRCTRWDPRRANRWRHPVVRLVGEYLLAYVTALWRAPISWPDRLHCLLHLILWTAGHVDRLLPGHHLGNGERKRRPVRRVALYGFLASGNIGNDASFETVLSWLRAEHADVDVQCVTIAPEEAFTKYCVPSTPLSWRHPQSDGQGSFALVAKALGRVLDVPHSLTVAGSVDAVVIPGMGVLEESLGVRPWGLPWWLFLTALACRARRRPFVLLDVGAEPIGNPLTRRLFVATARLASHVTYRDKWSADAMREAGAPRTEGIAPDLAFAHDAPTQAHPQPGLVVVGVMAYYGPSDNRTRGAEAHDRYVAALSEALVHLVDAGDRVVLIGGDRADAEVAHEVLAAIRTARPWIAPGSATVRHVRTFTDVTRELSHAEVVIASRFHNLIAALRLARPTVSISYAEKSTQLMNSLGLGDRCQAIECLDADRLTAQVRSARADHAGLVARAAAATKDNAEEVRALMRRMGEEALGLPRGEPAAALPTDPAASDGISETERCSLVQDHADPRTAEE